MGLLKGSMMPTAQLLIVVTLLCVGQVACVFNCRLKVPLVIALDRSYEPQGLPLVLDIEIHIIGVREVTTSGSFDVDV